MNTGSKTRAVNTTIQADLNTERLQDYAGYQIVRLGKIISANFERHMRKIGVTTSAIQALSVVAENDGITVNDLSEASFVRQSTLTKILDRLEDAGLVRREVATLDRRWVHIFITRQGRSIVNEMYEALHIIEGKLLDSYSSAEREELLDVLSRLNAEANSRLSY